MGERSSIEWTHHTFNPWIGCAKVHSGCKNCYAETQNKRWAYNGGTWGVGAPRKVTSDGNWRKPLTWAKQAAKAGERHRVFCASLADVLDEEAPVVAQARLWHLIRETAHVRPPPDEDPRVVGYPDPPREGPGLDWLLLTKRPERWEVIPPDVRPSVWLGTSISDQETADVWIPRLLRAEGFALRFLSLEPMVGPVDLGRTMRIGATDADAKTFGLSWIIVGGESGPRARPCDVAWIRSIVEQCRAASVPCFVKQLGGVPTMDEAAWRAGPGYMLSADNRNRAPAGTVPLKTRDKKGGDQSEWPADLRIRQFPPRAP